MDKAPPVESLYTLVVFNTVVQDSSKIPLLFNHIDANVDKLRISHLCSLGDHHGGGLSEDSRR